MKLKIGIALTTVLGLILFSAVMSGAAFAQASTDNAAPLPGQPAENPGSRADTMQGFDRWVHDNPQAAKELKKDPSLINNSDWMAKHPDLNTYMNNHPDFKQEMQKNPDRMMRHGQADARRAKTRHEARREHRAKPQQ